LWNTGEVYTVQLYARVRRAVVVDKMSEREAAKQFGLARERVRKMLRYSVPPVYRRQQAVRRPKLDAWVAAIDQILEDDKAEGRKQRHMSSRIRPGPFRAFNLAHQNANILPHLAAAVFGQRGESEAWRRPTGDAV
jgi:hypothetical protein